MKVLVFEYISGGGFNRQALPESLGREGLLMLQALLDDFADLDGQQPTVMLDARMTGLINLSGFRSIVISDSDNCLAEFETLVREADAIWPVAPETGGLLESLCRIVERHGKMLLTSPSSAVAVTGNKLQTYRRLRQNHISTVPTFPPAELEERFIHYPLIIKPVDGVGCEDSRIADCRQDIQVWLGQNPEREVIMQPLVRGHTTSLSCLFKHGKGWLICANLQVFRRQEHHFSLSAICVNDRTNHGAYGNIVADIAAAFPDLWGYAGIDLIETRECIRVLEINPRLTTSYAGIRQATGINIAAEVMALPFGNPVFAATRNKKVIITMNKENNAPI